VAPTFSLLSLPSSDHSAAASPVRARRQRPPPSTTLPAPATFSPSAPRGRWCLPSPSRRRRPAATPASEPNPDLGAWRCPSASPLSAPPPSAALPPPPHCPSARPLGGPRAPPRHSARRAAAAAVVEGGSARRGAASGTRWWQPHAAHRSEPGSARSTSGAGNEAPRRAGSRRTPPRWPSAVQVLLLRAPAGCPSGTPPSAGPQASRPPSPPPQKLATTDPVAKKV